MRLQNFYSCPSIKSLLSSGRFTVWAMSLVLVAFLAACTTDDTSSDIIVTDTTAPTLTDGSCPTTVASAVDGVFTWTDPTYADETDAATDLVIMVTALVGEETTTIEDADANTEGFQYSFATGVTTATITYTVTDSAGNSTATISDDFNDCTFTVTAAPAIVLTAESCPANMVLEMGTEDTGGVLATWTAPTYAVVNVDPPAVPVVAATAVLPNSEATADPTVITETAGTDTTYMVSLGDTVVTYTATSGTLAANTDCTFTITVQTKLFEFPSTGGDVSATVDGMNVSDMNAFTCAEGRWGFGYFTCTNNPQIDFTSNGPTEGAVTTVYERVEIEIIHGTYQEKGSDDRVTKCNSGNPDYAEDLCPISIIATDMAQSRDQRELTKTSSSIELMRYVPNYGIATDTEAAQRTLREDITHLWPYLQGKTIYLSMNNASSSSGGAPMIEGLKVILTAYGEGGAAPAPTPGDGTSLPYKVAPAFGNGINQVASTGVNNRQFLYQNDITTGNSLLTGDDALVVPTTTVTAEDLTNISQLEVYLYATGRREYNVMSSPLPLTFLLDTDNNLDNGAVTLSPSQDIYNIDIEIPATEDDYTDYNRVLPADSTITAPDVTQMERLADAELPGWRPGQRVPYFMYSQSIGALGSLSLEADSELFLNVTTTAEAINSDDGDDENYILMLAGSYVFYSDY